MLTIEPLISCLIIIFTARCVTIAGAVRFRAITRSHMLLSTPPTGSNLSIMPKNAIGKRVSMSQTSVGFCLSICPPAQLTTISRCANAFSACANMSSSAESFVISHSKTSVHSGYADDMLLLKSSIRFCRISQTTTFAPSTRKASAIAFPDPRKLL